MTTTKPKFLTVPLLYEEGKAAVSWETMSGAEQYELDMIFDDRFETADYGKTWLDAELADWKWSDQDENTGLTWKAIEKLCAQGLMWRNLEFMDKSWAQWDADAAATWRRLQEHPVTFTVYRGPGIEVLAPDQGRTWRDMDNNSQGWAMQDSDSGVSWRQMEHAASIGLEWRQHDQNGYSWAELESAYIHWWELENQPARGLGWSSLEGRWKAWAEIETLGNDNNGLTWRELECLPADNQAHRSVTVEIPLYTKSSMLRVRGLNSQEDTSRYITTEKIPHLPRSLARYKLPCLHVPTLLYEGKSSEIVWGDLYGASRYVLERKCGGNYGKRYDGAGHTVNHPAGCSKPQEHYYGSDCKQHLAYTDPMPYGQKTAQYRIKGYNTTDISQYLESAIVPIIPVFYRDDRLSLAVTQNRLYQVQLHAENIHDFENIPMELAYGPGLLEIDKIILEQPGKKADYSGKAFKANSAVTSQAGGKIQFRCTRPMVANREWSGFLLSVSFRATGSGNVEIQLF